MAVAIGTVLLSLPAATEGGERPHVIDALFTATSAVCITGLTVVETGSYWSAFGHGVILILIQVGGLGIITLSTLLVIFVSRRLGLRSRLLVQAETRSLHLHDIRWLVRNIVLFALGAEAVIAIVLTARFMIHYERPWRSAAYDGVFHAVSGFNSAGFSLNPNSMMRYVGDPWVTLTIAFAVILGGLGFPVVFELAHSWR